MDANRLPDGPRVGRHAGRLYSVPRHYDLATLMAVTFAFALMFGVLRRWNWPPAAIGAAGLLVTLVGLGQALLFGGRHPRIASIVVGVLCLEGVLAFLLAMDIATSSRLGPMGRGRPLDRIVVDYAVLAFFSTLWGAIWGYLVGVMIGGVFLVGDLIRRLLHRIFPAPRPPLDDRDMI